MEYGIKHLVTCRCILSQFKKSSNPPLHKFVVFSVVDENDVVNTSMVKCNNCGITHKITNLCKSDILENSDDWQSISIEDIKLSTPPDLREVLESYDVDLPTWQMANWIIDSSRWGEKIILNKKDFDDRIEGKFLTFKGPMQYRIETFLEVKNEL
tara:strand:- start:420 stop:884 length:465 start_codon:yes stop_codon:yes gene_type:complete